MKRIIQYIVVLMGLWSMGLAAFIYHIPTSPAQVHSNSDAIVVLTGAPYRLNHGFERLIENKAEKLFISGVGKNTNLVHIIRELPIETKSRLSQAYVKKIVLGREATNTIENAEETLKWTKDNAVSTIYLVTSNYHLPRSLRIFSDYMKKTAMNVTIYPDPVVGPPEYTGFWLWQPRLLQHTIVEYHKWAYYMLASYLNLPIPVISS